jgi:hypothetical protein
MLSRETRVGAPGGTFSRLAAFEPAINGSKGRYAKPGYTTGAADTSKTGFIYLFVASKIEISFSSALATFLATLRAFSTMG